jgi:hypothetical protein
VAHQPQSKRGYGNTAHATPLTLPEIAAAIRRAEEMAFRRQRHFVENLHKHRGGKNIDARDVSSIAPFSSGGYAGRTNATAESLGGIISA